MRSACFRPSFLHINRYACRSFSCPIHFLTPP
jgi:hypothetical protein